MAPRMNHHPKSLPRNSLIHRLPIRVVADLHVSPVLLFDALLLLLARPQARRSSVYRFDRGSGLEVRCLVLLVAVHYVWFGVAHVVGSGLARSDRSRSHACCRRPCWFAGLPDGRDAWWLDVGVKYGILGFVALPGGVFLFG